MREITTHLVAGLPANRQLRVFAEEKLGSGGAPVVYEIVSGEEQERGDAYFQDWLKFQNGGIRDPRDINGMTNEALLAIVIDRLECFQRGPFPCNENHMALGRAKEALAWLMARTEARLLRGVEGKEEA